MKKKEADEQLERVIEQCRTHGLRRTHALRELLRYLLKHNRPVNWTVLSKEPEIRACCDPSSAFRVMVKLEEIGLVRRMGSPDRSYYYILTLPGEHHDYLICKECGKIDEIEMDCPVQALEKKITRRTGYRELYHELDFFGLCPKCQAA